MGMHSYRQPFLSNVFPRFIGFRHKLTAAICYSRRSMVFLCKKQVELFQMNGRLNDAGTTGYPRGSLKNRVSGQIPEFFRQ